MAKIIIDKVLLDHLLIKLHPLCAWDSFLYRPLVHTKHHFWWQDIFRSFFYIVTYYTPNTIFGGKTKVLNTLTIHKAPILLSRHFL